MLALNSFPATLCGHVVDPEDAYLFMQINDGNAIAIPYAKGMGWGAELRLKNIFEQLFVAPGGGGYPKDRVVPEQRNKKILDEVKKVTYRKLTDILPELDRELVKGAFSGEHFMEYFERDCKDAEILNCVKKIMC